MFQPSAAAEGGEEFLSADRPEVIRRRERARAAAICRRLGAVNAALAIEADGPGDRGSMTGPGAGGAAAG